MFANFTLANHNELAMERSLMTTPGTTLNWTSEQILGLAPDASSAKAGRELAAPRKWVTLGYDEATAWGECQGSGKTPYQASIDLAEPAFRCTCPSRKFPCKHGLGLFLLLISQPALFSQKEAPVWVSDWLKSRTKRAEQKTNREERGETTRDTAAQAKRAEQRQSKVEAGLRELDLWLRDLVRRGLTNVYGQPYSFWDGPAARLVDAQAPGLARLVREMAGIASSGEGWQEKLLVKLSRLHLLMEGYKNLEALPPSTQADVRSLIGWTQNQDELMSEEGLLDHWLVLGQRVEDEDKLRVQRTWLWGQQHQQPALVLSFAFLNQPLDKSLVPGTAIEAELVFWASAYPLRALVKGRKSAAGPVGELPGYDSISEGLAAYAGVLTRQPWLEEFPLLLKQVVLVRYGEHWAVRDGAGHLLPLAPRFEQVWKLLALSGGQPLPLFGEWNSEHFAPLSTWHEGKLIGLKEV